jgi:hypothetical protein
VRRLRGDQHLFAGVAIVHPHVRQAHSIHAAASFGRGAGQQRLPDDATMHTQVEGMIGGEQQQRVGTRVRGRRFDHPVESHHAVEPVPNRVGVGVALDHQEVAARVGRQHAMGESHGRAEVERLVFQQHDRLRGGWRHVVERGQHGAPAFARDRVEAGTCDGERSRHL